MRRGYMTLAPVKVAARSFIGNSAVVAPGTEIAQGALIGVSSSLRARASGKAEYWFGSRRSNFRCGNLRCRRELDLRALLRAQAPARRVRGLLRLVADRALHHLRRVRGRISRARRARRGFRRADPAIPRGGRPHLGHDDARGLRAQMALMGVYKPIMKPMWSWFALRSEAIAVAYSTMASRVLLDHLHGTPMLAWCMRLFGARSAKAPIGRRPTSPIRLHRRRRFLRH